MADLQGELLDRLPKGSLPTDLAHTPILLPEVSPRFKYSADFVEFFNKRFPANKQPRLNQLL